MSGINKVILIGNMGKNPETKTFENGSKKVGFTLATTEFYKDKDGTRKELTEWHNVVCWRALADFAEKYLAKGRKIYVEGKLKTRSWEKDGQIRRKTEVIAENVQILYRPDIYRNEGLKDSKNDAANDEAESPMPEENNFNDIF